MDTNLTKEQAIALAKKALKDIGHWENFKIEGTRILKKSPPYDFNYWLVWFNFTEKDYDNGVITPTLTINDEAKKVISVSWKKSVFVLLYDKEKDKYNHPTLSREQPKLK
jgi:hypothetical protein